jgi:hypothetical protein
MISEAVAAALRDASHRMSPAATARLLDSLLPEGLRQDTLIFHFKRALPEIPLKVLLDAQAWNAVGPGDVTDAEFNEMLRPWWPTEPRPTGERRDCGNPNIEGDGGFSQSCI